METIIEALSWDDLVLRFSPYNEHGNYIFFKIGNHSASFKDQKSIDQIIEFLKEHRGKLIPNPYSNSEL